MATGTASTGRTGKGRLPAGAKTKAETKEVRPRSEEPIYLDLQILEEKEDPRFYEIQEYAFRRRDAKEMEKAAIEARKAIDEELAEIIDRYQVDGILVDDVTGIDRIVRASPRKVNDKYLKKILTPDQYAQAWIDGQPNASSYMKDISNPDKIAELRGE